MGEHLQMLMHVLGQKDEASLVLTGAWGLGRRTMVRFLCHCLGYRFRTPFATQGFALRHFAAFLKDVLVEAAIHGNRVCLYLDEYQIVDERMFDHIHDLLSSGEVRRTEPLLW